MIQTKIPGLQIRRIVETDWRAVQSIWQDQENHWYGQYDHAHDLEDQAVQKRIALWASFQESTEHMMFAACLQRQLIGYISFNRRENGYEIGYNFHSDFHRRGYARESLTVLMARIGELHLSRHFIIRTALKNVPSIALLQSLGFRQTGTEQVSFYRDKNGNEIWFDGGIFELEHPEA